MSVFGEYFRSRREDLGLSQRDAAKRLGVSANTVARWERGKAVPSAARAASLRDVLGISRARIADLVGGKVPPTGAETAEARIAELEDRIVELEARCAQPVTSLEDQFGNKITLGSTGIRIQSVSQIELVAASRMTTSSSIVEMSAGAVQVDAGIASFSGVVQSDTVVTNSVVSSSYTPGAGNIW